MKYVTVVFKDAVEIPDNPVVVPGKHHDYKYDLNEEVEPLDLLVVDVKGQYKFVRVIKVLDNSDRATAFIKAKVHL